MQQQRQQPKQTIIYKCNASIECATRFVRLNFFSELEQNVYALWSRILANTYTFLIDFMFFFFILVFCSFCTVHVQQKKKNMFWLITSHQAVDEKRKSKYTFHTLHISFTFPQATVSSYIFLVFHFGFVAYVRIHHVHVLCLGLHSTRVHVVCMSMCLCSQHST